MKPTRSSLHKHSLHRSKGVALIIGLIFLILLTLFVLGGMRDVLLQERMAGAYRNESLAENARDSLIRNAEANIFKAVVEGKGNVAFAGISAIESEDSAAGALPIVSSFRTGVGYVAGGTVPSNDFQNVADEKNDLSTTGGYVIEGPIPVEPDNGLEGSNSGSGYLESHQSIYGTGGSGSGDGTKGGALGNIFTYRITARATGGTDDFVRAGDSNYTVTN